MIQSFGDALLVSLSNGLSHVLRLLPTLVGAVLLLVLGLLLATVVERLVVKVLNVLGFERAVQSSGLSGWLHRVNERWTATRLLGRLSFWFVVLLFVQGIAGLFDMPVVGGMLTRVLLFLPRVAVAVAILVVGAWLGRIAASAVRASLARLDGVQPNTMARLAQYAVVGLAVVAAVAQLRIAGIVVEALFIAVIGSVALAVGLAFGLGGRDVAGRITQRWYERSQDVSSQLRNRTDLGGNLPPVAVRSPVPPPPLTPPPTWSTRPGDSAPPAVQARGPQA